MKLKNIKTFTVVFAVIIVVLNIYFAFNFYSIDNNAGVFGDAWGFSNSIFSFLSIILILITISSQKADTDKQFKLSEEQGIKDSVLRLISTHSELTKELKSTINNKEIYGRSIFKSNYEIAQSLELDKIIDHFKREMFMDLNHYYFSLYRILKTIDALDPDEESKSNKISKKDTYILSKLFRSQLSIYELYWLQIYLLFYKTVFGEKDNRLDNFIEQYSLFKNLKFIEPDIKNIKIHIIKNNILDDGAYEPIKPKKNN